MSKLTCYINLYTPPKGFYKPGEVVSGVIKLTVLEPVAVPKITTSLKGVGNIIFSGKNRTCRRTTEVLVDIDNIVQDEKSKMACGSFEIKFSFTLPHNIPSTMQVCKSFGTFKATCFIKYNICLKFEGPGLLSIQKLFRREIIVVSDVAPKLPREPTVYIKSKKLIRLFSNTEGLLNIKATILNSALPLGGKAVIHYEVENNSQVIVKNTLTKLVQAYIFKADGREPVTYEEDIPRTDVRTTLTESEGNCSEFINLQVPSDVYSLQTSKIIFRYYLIRIITELSFLHGKMIINIPVQIGVNENIDNSTFERDNEDTIEDDLPPSYWEIMGESKNENEDSSDENDDNDKNKIIKDKNNDFN